MAASGGAVKAGPDLPGHAKRDREEEDISPLSLLDKATVLQECRVFNDASFVQQHPKRCCMQLTKLLYLLSQGERFSGHEADEVFFGVTKLFQSPDHNLRRMVYLFLKEMTEFTDPEHMIIVVASLVKDMNDTSLSVHRASAIRVLTRIVDAPTLSGVDRYLRQAIIDPSSEMVASAALVSGYHLSQSGGGRADIVKRWVGEIQTALKSHSPTVQFHALLVDHAIRRGDNLAVSRLMSQLMRGGISSPLAQCMVIRYSLKLVRRDPGALDLSNLYNYLESLLRHPSHMVVLEAARSICLVPGIDSSGVRPAVDALSPFLSEKEPATRLAAARTLNNLSLTMPTVVARCNEDLNLLVSEPNRNLATYAITTLLRTGEGPAVENLLKQIGSFMGELNSEFKVKVVRSIHDLCLRMPDKAQAPLTFLATAVRDEAGFEVKRSIVDSIIHIMERIPSTKIRALFDLCEFIEDCEYSSLSVRVLHLLGDVGPSTPRPSAFLRFVYNRTILEKSVVRAAAVTTLAKFAARVASLRNPIITLLQRCREDDDDEVRDRATTYVRALQRVEAEAAAAAKAQPPPAATQGGDDNDADEAHMEAKESSDAILQDNSPSVNLVHGITRGALPMSVSALQRSLTLFQMRPAAGPFSFASLPQVDGSGEEMDYFSVAQDALRAREKEEAEAAGGLSKGEESAGRGAGKAGGSASERAGGAAGAGGGGVEDNALAALYEIPEFAELGTLFRSSPAMDLTEAELEYLVKCTRHVFAEHVVFEFEIRNTVADTRMENAMVSLTDVDGAIPPGWEETAVVAASVVRHNVPARCYVCLLREPGALLSPTTFTANLKFDLVELSDTGEPLGDGIPEEFPLEDLVVTIRDLVAPQPVSGFRAAWDAVGAANEEVAMLRVPVDTVARAVSRSIPALGLSPCEGSGSVSSDATKHQTVLAGTLVDGTQVLARLQVVQQAGTGCAMKVAIRSSDKNVSRALVRLLE